MAEMGHRPLTWEQDIQEEQDEAAMWLEEAAPAPRFSFVIEAHKFTMAVLIMQQATEAAARAERAFNRLVAVSGRTNDSMRGLSLLFPLPEPPPKTESGMTAREYRAARRAYRRYLQRGW